MAASHETGHVSLADSDAVRLNESVATLTDLGHTVEAFLVDRIDAGSFEHLASVAVRLGQLRSAVYASAVPASVAVQDVLHGTSCGAALCIDRCAPRLSPGGSLVALACAKAYQAGINADDEAALGHVPPSELLDLPFVHPDRFPDAGCAYRTAQRGVQMPVRATASQQAAARWQINSVTVGNRAACHPLTAVDEGHRVGPSATDVAAAVTFLLGESSSGVCGSALLVAAASRRLTLADDDDRNDHCNCVNTPAIQPLCYRDSLADRRADLMQHHAEHLS
ncbi:Rossmann-fold NAD(P)-binding domain-containing protein [Mycolicibacterium sarraceniae]|uniref:hypothetical protein n=1 Tax=Mycolicibacterium sarraceniae TaxID=1534348 RepID=UPI0013D23D60|nr:hypothetical protein [Mycolicibacterium sarraceniae]